MNDNPLSLIELPKRVAETFKSNPLELKEVLPHYRRSLAQMAHHERNAETASLTAIYNAAFDELNQATDEQFAGFVENLLNGTTASQEALMYSGAFRAQERLLDDDRLKDEVIRLEAQITGFKEQHLAAIQIAYRDYPKLLALLGESLNICDSAINKVKNRYFIRVEKTRIVRTYDRKGKIGQMVVKLFFIDWIGKIRGAEISMAFSEDLILPLGTRKLEGTDSEDAWRKLQIHAAQLIREKSSQDQEWQDYGYFISQARRGAVISRTKASHRGNPISTAEKSPGLIIDLLKNNLSADLLLNDADLICVKPLFGQDTIDHKVKVGGPIYETDDKAYKANRFALIAIPFEKSFPIPINWGAP